MPRRPVGYTGIRIARRTSVFTGDLNPDFGPWHFPVVLREVTEEVTEVPAGPSQLWYTLPN